MREAYPVGLKGPGRAGEKLPIAPGWRSLGPWPSLLLSGLALLAVAALDLFAVSPERPAAIVFPRSVSADDGLRMVVAAGGLPIRRERSAIFDQLVWIAAADEPDFYRRVRDLGAWFVVNPAAFGGCLLARRP